MVFCRYPDDHGLRISRVGEARTSISDGSQVSLSPRVSIKLDTYSQLDTDSKQLGSLPVCGGLG
jgi:hypothetical protein